MLVYRTSRRPRATAALLDPFRAEAARLARKVPEHGEVRDLLVAFDELEGAVADALNPETDGEGAVEAAFRQAALGVGRAFLHSWEGRTAEVRGELRGLCDVTARLDRFDLPPNVLAAEAEGFAWYALYPETYLAAAQRFQAECRPQSAVCIGIRQIGAGLSAIVAAVLERAGCPVRLHTVRPRGHPFDRSFRPSPALAATLLADPAAHFLIVDEGPGLSGSSFASVAEVLSAWGIPDCRIAFFPSWQPDESRLFSAVARRRWPRHRRFTAGFEEVVYDRLCRAFPGRQLLDFSAGRWRPHLLPRPADYPAVQPQHERRKFLALPPGRSLPAPAEKWAEEGAEAIILARFAGFGRRGRLARERAHRLAEEGFSPPVLGEAEGFLLSRFVPGRPLTCRANGRNLLGAIAAYLACLRRNFPAADPTGPETLLTMIRVNVAEAFGEGAAGRLHPLAGRYVDTAATAIDGRMFPHEWLATRRGFVKIDGIEHHDDHFYPGGTDVAWDLAAAEIEFHLSPTAADYLHQRYAALAGDEQVARRLPFFRLAYLAFRLGYARLAADTLAGAEDGERFRRAGGRYARRLRLALSDLSLS